MAKATPDAVLDTILTDIALSTILHVCSGEPANYAGIAAVSLADVVMTAGSGNGDYTIGNGDTNGRKLAVAQQATITVDNTGTATHIALAVSGSSTLKHVTTCTSQGLTAANTVTVPTFDVEISDPA